MLNPTLSDLIGGIQIGDPRRRGGAPARHPEERARTQGAPDLRRARRDPSIASGSRSMPTSPTRSTPCCAATRSRPNCAGGTRRASIAARAGRGRRPASNSERSASPVWSARGHRGGWSPAGAATGHATAGIAPPSADPGGRAIARVRPVAGAQSRGGAGREPSTRGLDLGGWIRRPGRDHAG